MPLYEYYCQDCYGVFELLKPVREAAHPQPCPECDADAPRVISSFEAYVFRDGYPRRLPDRGTYWHLGKEVSEPVNKPAPPNAHPEVLAKTRAPEGPPTAEELDQYRQLAKAYQERQQRDIDDGRRPAVDEDMERKLGKFTDRVRKTAGRARLKRRRQPNVKSTAKTITGKHERTKKT